MLNCILEENDNFFEFKTNNDVHKVNKMMKLVSFKNSEDINNGKLINIKTFSK